MALTTLGSDTIKFLYAFLLSDKYILGLYTHCLVARKETASAEVQVEGFTEKEYGMVRLENVRDVLFQALLLDDVNITDNKLCTGIYTVYLCNNKCAMM